MLEGVSTFETSVSFYETTWHHVQLNGHFQVSHLMMNDFKFRSKFNLIFSRPQLFFRRGWGVHSACCLSLVAKWRQLERNTPFWKVGKELFRMVMNHGLLSSTVMEEGLGETRRNQNGDNWYPDWYSNQVLLNTIRVLCYWFNVFGSTNVVFTDVGF